MKKAKVMAAVLAVAGCLQAEEVPTLNGQGEDSSNLDPEHRRWIEASCERERSMGPMYYYPCIERNFAAIKRRGQGQIVP